MRFLVDECSGPKLAAWLKMKGMKSFQFTIRIEEPMTIL